MTHAPELLLELVKERAPDAQALARLTVGSAASVRFAASEVTTAVDRDVGELGLTVALGARHATAQTTRGLASPPDRAALTALAERALAMAKLAPEDPEWVGVLGAQAIRPVAAAWDAGAANLDAAARAKAARGAIALCEKAGVLGAGFVESAAERTWLASSAGLRAEHAWTNASFTMTARTPDGTGSGWAGADETRAADVDAGAIAARAVDKAVRSQRPRALPPGKYAVVLEPDAVGDLLGFLIEAMGAREADEGRSFFAKRGVGSKLFSERVTLRSDPFDALTPGQPFDGDGLALEPTTWIDRGTLGALAYSRYWAKKRGKRPTGAHSTFALSGGDAADTAALVKQVDRGLLVTRFWYTRWLDPRELVVTGLTRDGVFLIEKGAVTAAVNNFRFNESPVRMLARCTALEKTPRRVASGAFPVTRVPALLTHEFEMSSVSAAV